MALNDEDIKFPLEELLMIVKDWISSGKYVNYLVNFRQANDTEWIDREVLLYVLRKDVFDSIDIEKLLIIFSNVSLTSILTVNVRSRFQQLIVFEENNLNDKQICWERHYIMCAVMKIVSAKFHQEKKQDEMNVDLSTKQLFEAMFVYIMKLIERSDHWLTIESACHVLAQLSLDKYRFQFNKYEASIQKLVCLPDSAINAEHIRHRHLSVCNVLHFTLGSSNTLFSNQTCGQIFDYLMKLIERFDHGETIVSACDALAQLPFRMYSFQFDKYEAAIQKLIEFSDNPLDTEQIFLKHYNLCHVMEWALKNCKDTLSPETCCKILNIYWRVIQCDDKRISTLVFVGMHCFPFNKCQSSLLLLIDSVEMTLNEEHYRWDKHGKFCVIMIVALKNYKHLLSQRTFERMLNYLAKLIETCDDEKTIDRVWGTLKQFPFEKCQPLLMQLIDLAEKKFNVELCTRDRLLKLCRVLKKVMATCKYSLSEQTHNRFFDYIMKLFERYADWWTINSAWGALKQFPFDQYQSALLVLIDFVQNKVNQKQPGWNGDGKLCEIIVEVMVKCKGSLSRQTCGSVFDYLVKLIETCDDVRTINCAWRTFKHFPFDNYHQSSLLMLIDLAEKNVNKGEQCGWDRHRVLSEVAVEVIGTSNDLLCHRTCERMFGYLMKLIETCDHKETIDCAWNALRKFPFTKNQSFMLHLIDLVEKNFNVDRCEWEDNLKLCEMMEGVLMRYKDSLSQQICKRLFDILENLMETCGHEKTIISVCSVFKNFPFNKYQSSLKLMINLANNKLIENNWEWVKHKELCEVMRVVLKYWKNSLNYHIFQEMSDYFVKLIEICDHEDTIANAFGALKEFPYDKCQFLLLIQLIDLAEIKFNGGQCVWDRHTKLCKVIDQVLDDCKESLNHQTCERVFAYLVKLIDTCEHEPTIESSFNALKIFPYIKYQSSMQLLIDLANSKLNDDHHWGWNRFEKLCTVMGQAMEKCKDSLNDENCKQIFNYLVKLIERCDHEETCASAWGTLRIFPFVKYQSSLLLLIVRLNSKQYGWNGHIGLCGVLTKTLDECKDLLSKQTCDEIFLYLMKLIERCDNSKTNFCAWGPLQHFPFEKYQSLMLQLIDLAENKFNADLIGWDKHAKLCEVMGKVLEECKDSLSQVTHQQMFDYLVKLIEKCDHNKTIYHACDALYRFPANQIQLLLVQICQALTINIQSPHCVFQKHQNWCKILDKILCDCKDLSFFNENFLDQLVEYFIIFFNTCDHVQTMLSIIYLIENLCLKRLFGNVRMNSMKDNLMKKFPLSECPLGRCLPSNFDYARYQLKWCARWCLDNMMGEEEMTELPIVKLSVDGLEARSNGLVPVGSPFTFPYGIYFYEVIIVTNGKMQFGWTTREVRFNKRNDLGCSKSSVCFDTSQKCILQNGDKCSVPNQSSCCPGDVIGCLIDCVLRRFVFYYNGQPIKESKKIDFTTTANYKNYYANAFLTANQQCHFNFGQAPFKFVPDDVQFNNFHLASGGNVSKYRLTETCDYNGGYWFKHSPIDNQVNLLLSDKMQNDFDKVVARVEEDIEGDREIGEWRLGNMERKKWWRVLRYIQAIIEVMGKVGVGDKVDVMAQWVGTLVEEMSDEVRKAKMLELLYPYTQLRINSPQDFAKHRNICILLCHLIMFSKHFYRNMINNIRTSVFTYLTRTLTSTSDEWTQLFVLIALDNLKLSKSETKALQENCAIVQLLNKWKNSLNYKNIVEFAAHSNGPSIFYQLRFMIEYFLNQVSRQFAVPQDNPAALSINDLTADIKLSSDQLSVRSDWRWQSVRSTCHVNRGIYYFEAILLTNGPMRIGWSTVRNELAKTVVGGDDYSIGFDGYNQCVWHKEKKLQFVASATRWKAGDVIGCLIEVFKNKENRRKQFSFYLNGQLIKYKAKKSIYSSPHPYHASISLYSHQQVWFNFGQAKFKYPPEIDYLTFWHYSKEIINRKSAITIGNINSSVVNVDSTSNIQGNVSISYQKVMAPSTIEHILKKGLTSEFITCPACYKKIYMRDFFSQCCECLKLSIEKPTGTERLAITLSEEESRKRKIFEDMPNLASQANISAKRIKSDCCENCGKMLPDCLNCRDTPSTSSASQLNPNQMVQCQLCDQVKKTRALQFVGCEHMKLCRDCVPDILDCPKCKANKRNCN